MTFTNNFEHDLQVIKNLLRDTNIRYESRYNLMCEFCENYPYFDSSKLDIYLI